MILLLSWFLKLANGFPGGRGTVRFLLVIVSGIKMICYQIPSVSADRRLTFPHPQVVAERWAFKESEIIGVVPAEGQLHSSTQRACPLLAKMQTGISLTSICCWWQDVGNLRQQLVCFLMGGKSCHLQLSDNPLKKLPTQ